MDHGHTIKVLNHLIEICRDGHDGYQAAAHAVGDMKLKKIFGRYALERKELAEQIGAEIVRIGGKPIDRGSVKAALHRGWIELTSRGTWTDDHHVLIECERGEKATLTAYSEATSESLPSIAKALVERQFRRIAMIQEEIEALERSAV